jgi:drug/metabolite transporter (DMT)-like permease
MQAVIGFVFALWDGQISVPTAEKVPLVATFGLAGLVAHFCVTRALQNAPATIVYPIDFFRLPLIALIGMLFYAEPLTWPVVAGAALILLGNTVNIFSERRHNVPR